MDALIGKIKASSQTFYMNNKFNAAGLIFKYGCSVLLGKRASFCNDLHGYWSMPCGEIEDGELPQEAAVREFYEETNIRLIQPVSYLTKFTMKNGGVYYVFSTEGEALALPSEKAPDAMEHEEWGYFKISKRSLPTPMTKETKESILMLK